MKQSSVVGEVGCSVMDSDRVHLAYLGQGGNYHVARWLPALAQHGLRVSLLSFTRPESSLDGVEFHHLTAPSGPAGPSGIRDFWGSTYALRRLLETIGADVLLASYATNYGWLGARTGFRPLVVQTWTADLTEYPVKGPKRLLFGPIVRRVLAEADLVTTDGDALAEEARALYPKMAGKFEPIRWGIPLKEYDDLAEARKGARSRLGLPADATVITSGRGVLEYYRPIEGLRALLAVLEGNPQSVGIALTLGRDGGPEVGALLERLERHPNGRVYDRFLTNEEMRDLWLATDVVISVPRFDGVSEGLLEAMWAGCVPVVSDLPSNRSILGPDETAVFVQEGAGGVLKLQEALEHAVSNLAALQERFVPQNRNWIRNHASIDASAARLASLIRRLVERP